MFDLNKLIFKKTDEAHGARNYSFVGIQKNKETDELEFWLPLGFDDFDEKDFRQVKDFFFKMYRTFKIYLQKKELQLKPTDKTTDRDGLMENENGFGFKNESNAQTILYGKLNSLEKIIEGYDELRISSLEQKQVRSHEIDYSKIHRYLHQAIYLDDDVIYLDEMNIAKSVLLSNSPPILQLFCFIYASLKKELNETISNKALELSEEFQANYLQPDSDLFGERTFAATVETLKTVLEDIDQQTTYKDEDFWHFFEAIEAFLYSERQDNTDGRYWGMRNFYDVWEDMCQNYVLHDEKYKHRVVFADINGRLAQVMEIDPINPFEVRLNHFSRFPLKPDAVLAEKKTQKEDDFYWSNKNHKKRTVGLKEEAYLRQVYPKIVKKFEALIDKNNYMSDDNFTIFRKFINDHTTFSEGNAIDIVDYKYMRHSDYERYNPNYINGNEINKVKEDLHKQLIYEWAVQQNWKNKPTRSEFWIPFYSQHRSGSAFTLRQEAIINNHYFAASKVKIIKVNFNELQRFYIEQHLT